MVVITFLLIASCLIWAANVACTVLSYWIPQMLDASFVLFIAISIEWVLMFYLCHKNGMDNSLIKEETPKFFVILGVLSLIYTVGNTATSFLILSEGGPHIENGVYCLWNHGFIREITREEYESLLLVESRFFSGLILAFSAAPMMIFSAIRERKFLLKHLERTVE